MCGPAGVLAPALSSTRSLAECSRQPSKMLRTSVACTNPPATTAVLALADEAPEPERAEHRLAFRAASPPDRRGGHAHHAAGGVPPGGRHVRAHDLDPLGRAEVDPIERRAPVGLGLGKSVHQHPHAARGPRVGAVAGAARAETADHDADVVIARARLRDHSRDQTERSVEPGAVPAKGILRLHFGRGDGRVEEALRLAVTQHRDVGQRERGRIEPGRGRGVLDDEQCGECERGDHGESRVWNVAMYSRAGVVRVTAPPGGIVHQ